MTTIEAAIIGANIGLIAWALGYLAGRSARNYAKHDQLLIDQLDMTRKYRLAWLSARSRAWALARQLEIAERKRR